jgi:hypothetical protein
MAAMTNGILIGLETNKTLRTDAVYALLQSERTATWPDGIQPSFYSTSLAITLGHLDILDLFIA